MLNLKKKCVPLQKQLLQLFDGVKYCNASMHDFYRVPGNVLIFSAVDFSRNPLGILRICGLSFPSSSSRFLAFICSLLSPSSTFTLITPLLNAALA